MSSSAEISAISDGSRLRQRVPPGSGPAEPMSSEDASQRVRELNADPKNKKTYGRTPDNTVFVVPTTHDMVSQLLDPRQPKNLSDGLVLAILALHILLAWGLPQGLKQPVFATAFLFWRACYNVGIGYLLSVQSRSRLLVTWARKWKLFEHPDTGANPRPWLYHLLKRELEAKIPEDYKFENAPIEYNTWLVFRRVVDLILMCDFVSYCLYAMVCARLPEGEGWWFFTFRLLFGLVLFGFNLWVKLDAHRVVKDYAWYWGDFFYLIDQELTFDGVFEMAPHPMYSIGYAGYYGISAWAASYQVLFISIAAHVAQLLFLQIVESPHIEKTYNPPPPRKRGISETQPPVPGLDGYVVPVPGQGDSPEHVHNILGFQNFDLFRTTDFALVLIIAYLGFLTIATPSTPLYQAMFVGQALMWRLWYSVGLGVILTRQSQDKMFTRHFLKYGESMGEAWRQWKSLYHISLVLCHSSFIAACWKMYSLPENWSSGWNALNHVLGLAMIALHAWTSASIYESLGEFGWFYGDFFFENRGKLTYGSIYRYLNNPERVIGTVGLWGAALMTWSSTIFVLALVGHLLTLGFLSYVEKPHMQKIYGGRLRDEAGLTKFIKRALPGPVKGLRSSVDKVIDDTTHAFDDFMETAISKLASGSSSIVQDFTTRFPKYPARLTISRISPDIAGLNPEDYRLSVEGTLVSIDQERATEKEGLTARKPKNKMTMVYEYGAPIKVKWTAPARHSKKDWIGLYMVTDNRSKKITEVPSLGRWVPTCLDVYDSSRDKGILSSDQLVEKTQSPDVRLVEGEMIFEGDKLWWSQGTFEFRYHHDGNHNVMAYSDPFEVKVGKFEEVLATDSYISPEYQEAVAGKLLPIARNCLDRDPDIAPNTVDESFGAHVERDGKYAKRVVYAIRHMFGIEFAPSVVLADGNVRKLAWRICNAKQVLAPFSMSPSRGPTTPVTDKCPEELKD